MRGVELDGVFRENLIPRLFLLFPSHELRTCLDDNCLLAVALTPLIACLDVVGHVCLELLEREGDDLSGDALGRGVVGLYEKVRVVGPVTADAVSHFSIIKLADRFGFGKGEGGAWKKRDVWENGVDKRLDKL